MVIEDKQAPIAGDTHLIHTPHSNTTSFSNNFEW